MLGSELACQTLWVEAMKEREEGKAATRYFTCTPHCTCLVMDPSIRHDYRQTGGRQTDLPLGSDTTFDQDFVCGIQNSYTYNQKSTVAVAVKRDVYRSDASINSYHKGGAMFDDGTHQEQPRPPSTLVVNGTCSNRAIQKST